MKIEKFGTFKGEEVNAIWLENKNNFAAVIITYGATLKNFFVRNKVGAIVDIVIGYDDLAGYINSTAFMGATIGPVANRIANARFNLNNKEYLLAANNGIHHLHGDKCLTAKIWKYETFRQTDSEGVKMTTNTHDGDFGYPGDVDFTVVYTLNSKNQLNIKFEAVNRSFFQTIVNMTNHSYFNLDETDSILDHVLKINCDAYLPVDETALVTGEIRKLDGKLTALRDGTALKNLADNGIIDIDNDFVKLQNNSALILESSCSGIRLTVTTSYPVFHIYCAQHFNQIFGKHGKLYKKCCAVAIEPQKHTNAINMPQFPSIVLDGQSKYSENITYTLELMD